MKGKNGCPKCPHEPHVVTVTLGESGSRDAYMHALPRVAALVGWRRQRKNVARPPLALLRPPHFQRQPPLFHPLPIIPFTFSKV